MAMSSVIDRSNAFNEPSSSALDLKQFSTIQNSIIQQQLCSVVYCCLNATAKTTKA